MRIVVLIKQVPDTWGARTIDTATGRLDRESSEAVIDEISEKSIEIGLQLKEQHGGEVIALTMGSGAANDVLRKALAMGADEALHICDDALVGADAVTTARVLAAAITKTTFDIVVAGNESTDGRGGVIPAMLAELLGVAQLTNLDTVLVDGTQISGERATEFGTVSVSAQLPAVISITERAAEARYPTFRGIMSAKKKPLSQLGLADLELSGGVTPANLTLVKSVDVRPAREAGIKVIDDGSAADQIIDYLVSRRVI